MGSTSIRLRAFMINFESSRLQNTANVKAIDRIMIGIRCDRVFIYNTSDVLYVLGCILIGCSCWGGAAFYAHALYLGASQREYLN